MHQGLGRAGQADGKELRWNGDDNYDYRTFNLSKQIWWDAGQKRSGSTLELVAYAKVSPPKNFAAPRSSKRGDTPTIKNGCPTRHNRNERRRQAHPRDLSLHDEHRELLFEVVRFDTDDPDKRFRQRQPDGKGGWIWNIKGVRRVLYRLPELIAAVKASERVLLCEGEKDANTAARLGYAATTAPGGINKWLKEYDEVLRGADLVIVSDNDQQAHDPETGKLQVHPNGQPVLPGQDYAAAMMRRLRGRRASAHDHPAGEGFKRMGRGRGHARSARRADRASAGSGEAAATATEEADGGLEDRIALDFSALHVERLRYVAVLNKWLQWNGVHWAFEDTLHAFHLARELCRDAEDARHKTVAAMVGLARTDRRQRQPRHNGTPTRGCSALPVEQSICVPAS